MFNPSRVTPTKSLLVTREDNPEDGTATITFDPHNTPQGTHLTRIIHSRSNLSSVRCVPGTAPGPGSPADKADKDSRFCAAHTGGRGTRDCNKLEINESSSTAH